MSCLLAASTTTVLSLGRVDSTAGMSAEVRVVELFAVH